MDPEKGIDPVDSPISDNGRKHSITGRKSSVAESIIAADLLDERYNITQRGLKSRHAQMIALGGTIGTGYDPRPSLFGLEAILTLDLTVSSLVPVKLLLVVAQHSSWPPT